MRSITPPRFYERFCVPLRLGANWGYWPSDSVFDQGGGVHHKLLMFLTWMESFACHWHQVQETSVLRLIRRMRAIEVKLRVASKRGSDGNQTHNLPIMSARP
jgi:hypothetical protein